MPYEMSVKIMVGSLERKLLSNNVMGNPGDVIMVLCVDCSNVLMDIFVA